MCSLTRAIGDPLGIMPSGMQRALIDPLQIFGGTKKQSTPQQTAQPTPTTPSEGLTPVAPARTGTHLQISNPTGAARSGLQVY